MAIEGALINVCLRTGVLLLLTMMAMMVVAPRANATKTGSVERRRTSADEHNQQVSSVTFNLTNSSLSEKSGRLPTYLNPGNSSGVGCVELRSKRYVSDGHCTSIRPLIEVVCSGLCLPVRTLPWYADYVKAWAGTSPREWRCVDDVVRKRKLTLICEDGTTRTYRVRVVKNCRCKQVTRRRHVDLEATTRRGKGGGGGGRQAEKGDLERPREVKEKKRKHGRKEQRLRHEEASSSESTT